MPAVVRGLLILVALVNLAPVIGVVSADRLQGLYGVAFEDPTVVLLMRHRAVLFGIVGGLLLAAALRPALRGAAMLAGAVSMLSFVGLAWAAGPVDDAIDRIVWIDLAALVGLGVAAALERARPSDPRPSARASGTPPGA